MDNIINVAIKQGFGYVLFVILLYWVKSKIDSTEQNALKREERLNVKIDEMEQRYMEREDRYTEIVNNLSIAINERVKNVEVLIEDIKEEIKINKK